MSEQDDFISYVDTYVEGTQRSSVDFHAGYQAGYAQAMREVREVEPIAWMYPSDLEMFQESEAFAQAFSICVGCSDETSVPLIPRPKGTDHE